MIDFEKMLTKESTADVIVALSGGHNGIAYPNLDRLFSRYKPEAHQAGELLKVVGDLSSRKIISMTENMVLKKGENWKEPEFLTEKKYLLD